MRELVGAVGLGLRNQVVGLLRLERMRGIVGIAVSEQSSWFVEVNVQISPFQKEVDEAEVRSRYCLTDY